MPFTLFENLWSAYMRAYVDGRQDVLVAIVYEYVLRLGSSCSAIPFKFSNSTQAEVKGNITKARLDSFNGLGMDISYTLALAHSSDTKDARRSVRIAFTPPLSSISEMKSRFLSMGEEAWDYLGMTAPESPQINIITLRVPLPAFLPFTCFCALVFRITGATAQRNTGTFFTPAYIIGTTLAIHCLEAIYTYALCRRYVRAKCVTAGYVLLTAVFGFPVLTALEKHAQDARVQLLHKHSRSMAVQVSRQGSEAMI
ncbi:hypothetical protein BJ138DRAFT_615506 [Hygrophoropsis aurantiaca]|uniref:Uncharacterized protein n=1 Tax=Hygrophoropsis aurantiaca TaxID=72124 RepID=A0ACB8AJW0_9AGAM|nr:hypothetical protein BJ138DRAFT_615506 [Hygrophoropsis aurantiaca]